MDDVVDRHNFKCWEDKNLNIYHWLSLLLIYCFYYLNLRWCNNLQNHKFRGYFEIHKSFFKNFFRFCWIQKCFPVPIDCYPCFIFLFIIFIKKNEIMIKIPVLYRNIFWNRGLLNKSRYYKRLELIHNVYVLHKLIVGICINT